MKHLRSFNESDTSSLLKEFFQDKIDWKFVHYMEKIITPYEDEGAEINYKVGLYSSYSNFITVWDCEKKYSIHAMRQDIFDALESLYDEGGLFYFLSVPNTKDRVITYALHDKILLKSELVNTYIDNTQRVYIVRPTKVD